jgi:hypothetical protein
LRAGDLRLDLRVRDYFVNSDARQGLCVPVVRRRVPADTDCAGVDARGDWRARGVSPAVSALSDALRAELAAWWT